MAEISLSGYPYPPPTSRPTSTITPEPDADGLLPSPDGVETVSTTISESDWARPLNAIHVALDSHDARALAGFIAEDGITVSGLGGSPAYVQQSGAETVFGRFFENGSRPVMQGYFLNGCIYLYTTGWVGDALLPDLPFRLGPSARRPIKVVEGPAFSWMVCKRIGDRDKPVICSWAGNVHYHNRVTETFAYLSKLYNNGTDITNYGPVRYHVLDPN